MIGNLTALSFNHIIGTVYIRLQIFVELNFTRLYLSSGKEKGSRCIVFTSSTKRKIRHFYLVVGQWRQRNVESLRVQVQSCCFPNLKLLRRLFKRSLTSVWQNRVLSHFQFAQRFFLSTIRREQFH